MIKQNPFFKKHASTILTYSGAVGLVITSVATAKAAVNAHYILEKAKKEKSLDLTRSEMVSIAIKSYISPILIGVSSIACIFGANILSNHQYESMANAYALVVASYSEYRETIKKLYGEETNQAIMNAIAVEKTKDVHTYSERPFANGGFGLEVASDESRLFYDEYSGRYFEATIEQVISSEYHLNRNYVLRGYAVLNELYGFLDLEPTEYGSMVGWSMLNGEDAKWIDFNHHKIVINDDLECYAIEISNYSRPSLFG